MHDGEEYDAELAEPAQSEEAVAAEEFYRRAEADDDSPTAQLRRFAHERIAEFYDRALSLVASYDGNRLMALDCMFLAMGKFDLVTNPATGNPLTCVELAVKHFADGTKKAAVSKCVAMFRDALGITGMPGQRTESGRKSMTAARKGQLQ